MKPEKRRTERLSVALTPDVMERIRVIAAQVGLSTNAWAAYTLGNAAMNQQKIVDQLSGEASAIISRILAEQETDETP